MKDMPTLQPAGLAIAALLPRADPRDAFVTLGRGDLRDAAGRQRRRHLEPAPRRPDRATAAPTSPSSSSAATSRPGSRKLADGVAVATFLAMAGLDRLGLDVPRQPIEPEEMLPAVAQGAIGVEARAGDARVARAARRDPRRRHRPPPRRRARLPRRPRRLLPDPDRRPRRARRRPAAPARRDPAPRRLRAPRPRRRGRGRRRRRARRRLRRACCAAAPAPASSPAERGDNSSMRFEWSSADPRPAVAALERAEDPLDRRADRHERPVARDLRRGQRPARVAAPHDPVEDAALRERRPPRRAVVALVGVDRRLVADRQRVGHDALVDVGRREPGARTSPEPSSTARCALKPKNALPRRFAKPASRSTVTGRPSGPLRTSASASTRLASISVPASAPARAPTSCASTAASSRSVSPRRASSFRNRQSVVSSGTPPSSGRPTKRRKLSRSRAHPPAPGPTARTTAPATAPSASPGGPRVEPAAPRRARRSAESSRDRVGEQPARVRDAAPAGRISRPRRPSDPRRRHRHGQAADLAP